MNKIKHFEIGGRMNIPKWTDKKLNILIPMAGQGSRF